MDVFVDDIDGKPSAGHQSDAEFKIAKMQANDGHSFAMVCDRFEDVCALDIEARRVQFTSQGGNSKSLNNIHCHMLAAAPSHGADFSFGDRLSEYALHVFSGDPHPDWNEIIPDQSQKPPKIQDPS